MGSGIRAGLQTTSSIFTYPAEVNPAEATLIDCPAWPLITLRTHPCYDGVVRLDKNPRMAAVVRAHIWVTQSGFRGFNVVGRQNP